MTCYYIGAPDIESDFSNEVVKTINQPPENQPPIADAGQDQAASAGDNIVLDGTSSSDPDGDIISYSWAQLSGPNVTLSDAGSSVATFTLPFEGAGGQVFSFQLTVKDNDGLQSSDTCSVRISEDIPPPVETVDVSGTWGSISTKGRNGIFSSFNLKNLGTANVESVMINFYKSEGNIFDESDYKMAEHVVSGLKVGAMLMPMR